MTLLGAMDVACDDITVESAEGGFGNQEETFRSASTELIFSVM